MRKLHILSGVLALAISAHGQTSSGAGFPSVSCTANILGQTYLDTTNNLSYRCVNISGTGYLWQLGQSPILPVASDPTGVACTQGLPNQQVLTTGIQYSCQNVVAGVGTWAALSGGASYAGCTSDGAGGIACTGKFTSGSSPTVGVHIGALGTPTDWNWDTTSQFTALNSVLPKIPAPQGPISQYFDDFFTSTNVNCVSLGTPSGNTCGVPNFSSGNHPGLVELAAGTAVNSGQAFSVDRPTDSTQGFPYLNNAVPWGFEFDVYVSTLPATSAYETWLGFIPSLVTASTTSGGAFFDLADTNAVKNDWYCGYGVSTTTLIDSGVAATVAYVRFAAANDGTKVHYYINGTEVCGTGIAIANYSNSVAPLAAVAVYNKTTAPVTSFVDYFLFRSDVSR